MEFQVTEDDIQTIREWLKQSPHLPQDLEDHYLASFIRGTKGSLTRTKLTLQNFFHARRRYPEMIGNIDPLAPDLKSQMQAGLVVRLPRPTADGTYIVVHDVINDDPAVFDPNNLFKHYVCLLKYMLMEDTLADAKFSIVTVCDKIQFGHVVKMSPALTATFISLATSAFPIRINKFHWVKCPPFLENLVWLVKKAVKPKIASRFHVHSNPNDLSEFYPKKILPSDFGGDEDSLMSIYGKTVEDIVAVRSKFVEEERKLRELDPLWLDRCDDSEVGTFRKLTVD